MHTTLDVLIKGKGANVVKGKPKDTVYECVLRMVHARIGGLLIMEGDKMVGIFTERDLLVSVVAKKKDPLITPVYEVMNTEVICVSPKTTTEEAMAIMTEKRVRHLPVLEDSKLHGLISIGDVTKWISMSHTKQAQDIDDLIRFINGGYSA
jgi:CBS domain-containing protein